MSVETLTENELPQVIKSRLFAWKGLWMSYSTIHYLLGTISVGASAYSAYLGGITGQKLSFIAATLTALIGFLNPERQYLKFVLAWRTLDTASIKFSCGIINKSELVDALERGESIITGFEDQSSTKSLGMVKKTRIDKS